MAYGVRLVRLDRSGLGWKLKFVCDAEASFRDTVQGIKDRVPVYARKWMPDEKVWWIEDGYLARVGGLFSNYTSMRYTQQAHGAWWDSDGEHDDAAHQSSSSPPRSHAVSMPPEVAKAYATLYVTADAPPEVVKASYRACAALYHPDHGGSLEHMKLVNLAFERAYQWAVREKSQEAG